MTKKKIFYFIALALLIHGTSLVIIDLYGKFLEVPLKSYHVISVIVAVGYTTLICVYKLRVTFTTFKRRNPNLKDR